MRPLFSFFIILTSLTCFVRAENTWILESSKLTYHVDHTFHHVQGESTAAKGKSVCASTGCDFLVAAPVKTFESGDKNRDLHMIQAVNGGKFPMVSVKTHLSEEPSSSKIKSDLTVDFAGKQIAYPGVEFEILDQTPDGFRVKGRIPLQLSRHNVKRPSLLGIAVKDEAPVDVEIVWKKGN